MEKNRFLKFENEIRPRVNAEIIRRLGHNNEGYAMAADFVKRKTFYLRPALTIIAARLFGASERKAMLPSVAIQLSNEWMLIHDDIEDGSNFRRHGPALHRVQGEAIAINTGDYLHSEAWNAIADYILEYGIRDGKRLHKKFSDMIRKTIVAQAMDLGFSRSIK
ncbi:MAG: polyprenyl synthetase family protein, partial [Rhabdochlamydiaceae bacterium]